MSNKYCCPFQGLLEAEKAIDPQLKELLSKAGAEEYVPVFAKKGVGIKQVIYMTDKQLSEVCIFFLEQPGITFLASASFSREATKLNSIMMLI